MLGTFRSDNPRCLQVKEKPSHLAGIARWLAWHNLNGFLLLCVQLGKTTSTSNYMDELYWKWLYHRGQIGNPERRWWEAGAILGLSPCSSDMGHTCLGTTAAQTSWNQWLGTTWVITMDCQMELEWRSRSLHLRGYLLNRGRRWHAFLINAQVHDAETASGTTVAIADKAKVYILMPSSHLATPRTLIIYCPQGSFF